MFPAATLAILTLAWQPAPLTLDNPGPAPRPLGRVTVWQRQLPVGPDAVALVLSGWQGPSTVKRLAGAGKLVSKVLTQIWDPASRRALQAGFVTFDRVNTELELEVREGRLTITAVCDFEGYRLPPGARVTTETLEIRESADPLASLHAWADRVHRHYRPKIWDPPPAGWVGWSWVDPFHIEPYEDVVRRNAAAIRRRLPGFDIPYLWVSLGNLRDREPGNWLAWNEALFPSGPRALVADLARQDFKLGLWAGIFWMSSRLAGPSRDLAPAFLRSGGQPITVPHRELGSQYVLDPTHPKAKEFIRHVFSTYREWGIRYYMIDFLYSISGSTPGRFRPDGYADPALVPGPQAYREGLRVIREAAGPDTYLLSSTGPTLWNTGLVDGARVGTDYGEGRPLDGPGKGFWPATFVINAPDFWTSHRKATDAWAAHFFTHRKLFLADSGNVLTIDKPVPLADARISATIFGLNGGPLMLGDDIEAMAEERLAMVKQLFPRLPESAEPLDLFSSPEPGYPHVFQLRVERPADPYRLLAVFNFEDNVLREKIDLGLSTPHTVWDFWDERPLPTVTGSAVEVTVAPRSVQLLRLAPERPHPWLWSTDLHVRQGQADIESIAWDEAAGQLALTAVRPPGSRGNLYVRAPKGWRLREAKGLGVAKDGRSQALVIRVPLAFTGPKLAVKIAFIRD